MNVDAIKNESVHPWPQLADHVLTLKLTPVCKPWPRFNASLLTGELLLHMLSQQKEFLNTRLTRKINLKADRVQYHSTGRSTETLTERSAGSQEVISLLGYLPVNSLLPGGSLVYVILVFNAARHPR
jgi:hypothetical protein